MNSTAWPVKIPKTPDAKVPKMFAALKISMLRDFFEEEHSLQISL
jgi:hypothetical protein